MALTDNGSKAVPASIQVTAQPRLSPNELRLLKAVTGKSLGELFGDEADAMQAMVYLRLRRDGYSLSWDEAGDVQADMAPEVPADPTMSAP